MRGEEGSGRPGTVNAVLAALCGVCGRVPRPVAMTMKQEKAAVLTGVASRDGEEEFDFLGFDSIGMFLNGKKLKELLGTL